MVENVQFVKFRPRLNIKMFPLAKKTNAYDKSMMRNYNLASVSANHSKYMVIAYGLKSGLLYDIGSPNMMADIDKGLRKYYESVKILCKYHETVNNIFKDIYMGKSQYVKSNPYMIDPIPDQYGIDDVILSNEKVLNEDLSISVNEKLFGKHNVFNLLQFEDEIIYKLIDARNNNEIQNKSEAAFIGELEETNLLRKSIANYMQKVPVTKLGRFFLPVEPIGMQIFRFNTDEFKDDINKTYERIWNKKLMQAAICYELNIYLPARLNSFINYKVNKTRASSPLVIEK